MASHKDVTRADSHAPGIIADHLEFTEASEPSTPAAGMVVIFAAVDGLVYQKDDAGTVSALGPGDITDYLQFDEVAAPGTPATGKARVYVKADGRLYIKDDAGTETDLTGTGGGGLVFVGTTTLGSAAATISVTGIPVEAGGTLVASFNGRSAVAATNDVLQVQLSAASTFDTGASYLYIAHEVADNSTGLITDTADTEVNSVRLGRTSIPGASAAANVAGGGQVWIPDYSSTVFYKSIHTVGGTADDAATAGVYRVGQSAGLWKNTAAVDGIQLILNSGANFVAGSTLRVVVL